MKAKKTLKITAFILVMIMLALFSAGTVLMELPQKQKTEEGVAQFRVSGIEVELEKFEILTQTVDISEVMKTNLEAKIGDNGKINGYNIIAREVTKGQYFSTSCIASGECEYPTTYKLEPGTYKITDLTLFISANNQNYTYIIRTEDEAKCADYYCNNIKFIKDKTFTLTDNYPEGEEKYEYFMNFINNTPEVSVGDKIKISVQRVDPNDEVHINRKTLKTMMLSYTNINGGDIINMYVKRVDFNPYLIIPSTATPGRYVLNYGYLTFTDGSTAKYKNTADQTFSYQSDFIVKEKTFDTSKYVFSNEVYGNNIKTDLEKLDNDAIITIDANKAPIIDEEIFKNIKGTAKTLIIQYDTSEWVFTGIDIKNPKSIDVSTLVSKLEKSNEYYDEFLKSNITSPSALLKFSDNGDLPGKVLIKIDSNSIDDYLKDPNSVYVYYYKEDADQLVKVAMEIQKNDGFYEFYINHNSKYIVSSEEIKTKAVSDNVEMLALNGQTGSSQTGLPMVYILATACGVLAMLLLIVSVSKGRRQSQQQTQES